MGLNTWAFRYDSVEEANEAYHRVVPREVTKKSGLSVYNILVDGYLPTIVALCQDDAWEPVGFGGTSVAIDDDTAELLWTRRAWNAVAVEKGEQSLVTDRHYGKGRRLTEGGELRDLD